MRVFECVCVCFDGFIFQIKMIVILSVCVCVCVHVHVRVHVCVRARVCFKNMFQSSKYIYARTCVFALFCACVFVICKSETCEIKSNKQ